MLNVHTIFYLNHNTLYYTSPGGAGGFVRSNTHIRGTDKIKLIIGDSYDIK